MTSDDGDDGAAARDGETGGRSWQRRDTYGLIAAVIIVVCALAGMVAVWMLDASAGKGAGGLVVVFPVIAIAGLHLVGGPAAIVFAVMSRSWAPNLLVFGYLTVGLWILVTLGSGGSPSEVIRYAVGERWRAHEETRENPDETRLCQALAGRVPGIGRTPQDRPALTLAELGIDADTPFDPDFMCRHREVELHPTRREAFYRSRPLELAVLALEPKLVAELIDRGAEPAGSDAGEGTLALLAVSGGLGLSTDGALQLAPRAERAEAVVTRLLAAGVPADGADEKGVTALHWSAAMGRPSLVRRLLASGGDADARAAHADRSPAYFAVDAVRRLERRGSLPEADRREAREAQRAILGHLVEGGADPEDVADIAKRLDAPWALEVLRERQR